MFPTTRWTLVARAGEPENDRDRERALADLCTAYWTPLYRYARRTGSDHDDARDLVQGVFEAILERGDLAAVRADRGRFRTWLLAAFRHHAGAVRQRARAAKRGGGARMTPIDPDPGKAPTIDPPDPDADPESAYLRDWAVTVLARSLDRLGGEYRDRGQEQVFEALRPVLAGDDDVPYAAIAERLGRSEGAIKVAAHRMRGRYRETLRREIEDTVVDPDAVDDELRRLFEALTAGR